MQFWKSMFDSARKRASIALWAIVVAVFGLVLDHEIDAIGLPAFIDKWWRSVMDYHNIIYAGLWISLGAAVAMQIDNWLRKRESALAKVSSIAFIWAAKSWDIIQDGKAENIHRWHTQTHGAKVKIVLIYEKHIVDSDIAVISTTPGVTWEEVNSSERFLIIDVDGRQDGTRLSVITVALGEKDRRPAKGVRKALFIGPKA